MVIKDSANNSSKEKNMKIIETEEVKYTRVEVDTKYFRRRIFRVHSGEINLENLRETLHKIVKDDYRVIRYFEEETTNYGTTHPEVFILYYRRDSHGAWDDTVTIPVDDTTKHLVPIFMELSESREISDWESRHKFIDHIFELNEI